MGCGCLIALASAISPRFGLFLVWLFTDRIPLAFDGNWLLPILGFFFLPWTTLAWSVAWAPVGGVDGFGWFVVIFAFLVDIGSFASADRARRERSTSYT